MCGAGMCRAARASIVLVSRLAKCRFQFLVCCGCVPGQVREMERVPERGGRKTI
nr:MAG TPA: hypothetical protein [Caudoviricetes sp.]